ncbi:uncharacterized protein F5147DRAFT_707054 [Suillus discolor]|uniref:Uncharacterized protein n=1 Tax=Suillus discolor TaxID=1912936 RepID=A0A9P7F1F1_9AGAM|nr:uncharacterized protein F5147DRAFT_707054 [Suillus discolor]KAG2102857.1 hypothetical protein F5147DRAFT_707054 [Suillus discolor]
MMKVMTLPPLFLLYHFCIMESDIAVLDLRCAFWCVGFKTFLCSGILIIVHPSDMYPPQFHACNICSFVFMYCYHRDINPRASSTPPPYALQHAR